MAEHTARTPDLTIGTMTVRGPGLNAGRGRALAGAIGQALAARLPAQAMHIGSMKLHLPASALTADGGMDETALAEAVTRWRSGNHGGGGTDA